MQDHTMRKQNTEPGSRASGCLRRNGKVWEEGSSPAVPGYYPRVWLRSSNQDPIRG